MHPVEIAFLIVVTVAWPLYIAKVRYPRLEREVAAGNPNARVVGYTEGILTQWVLAAIGVLLWLRLHPGDSEYPRTLTDLGLAFESGLGFWIGLAVTAALVALAVIQATAVVKSPEQSVAMRESLRSVSALLPRTARERNLFLLVSLTAGICEEILFRGYLMQWLANPLGLYVAAAASSLIFGLAHAYQGKRGILQTAAVGIVMAILTILTQSLFLPMLLHAAIDMNSGVLAYRLLKVQDG